MIGTYAAVVAVCLSSLAIGGAALALCGVRRWSWTAPAIGLGLLCALCWGTVRLPGHGLLSACAVLLVTLAAALYVRARIEVDEELWRLGLPVGALALLGASLPFLVEGHFGILGTGFNPDMSQHLLASDRLAAGVGSPLLHQGYPLGPHSIVVALNKGLGIGLVQGFDGLTVATAVLAPLTALAAFDGRPRWSRALAALTVGLAYLVASYFAQGAFKETMQALLVLGFVLVLREGSRGDWTGLPLRFLPAALIAAGSVYVYSFPGLIWLAGALVIWLALERSLPARALLLALLAFLVLIAPEIGRMIDFHSFETFDPNGPGLGNLFGQISPFSALGIWPSGDFRVPPGGGAAPALAYYFGAAFASCLLLYGLFLCMRRRETAILAGVVAAALAYAAARAGGTPYTAAKALEIAAPLLAVAILVPLARRPVGALYCLLAGGCAALALANAPVGPSSYSPALTGLRALTQTAPTLVLAPERLLSSEHGTRYIVWELRGGRVCVAAESEAGREPPSGVRFVIVEGGPARPPFEGLRLRRLAPPYAVWEDPEPTPGTTPCPLIAVRQARQGPAL